MEYHREVSTLKIMRTFINSHLKEGDDKTDQAAAIDASFVISVLKQLPNNHLMFLVFSHAAIHFVKMLQKQLQTVVTRWTLTISKRSSNFSRTYYKYNDKLSFAIKILYSIKNKRLVNMETRGPILLCQKLIKHLQSQHFTEEKRIILSQRLWSSYSVPI